MKKDVKVYIKGIHKNEGESSDVGVEAGGQYFLKGGKHYICYDEISEGLGEITKCIIKVSSDKNKVEILKKGPGATHMEFAKGYVHNTYLSTIAGKIFIGLDTKFLEVMENEDEIEIKIEYGLMMNNEKVSDCNIDIRIVC